MRVQLQAVIFRARCKVLVSRLPGNTGVTTCYRKSDYVFIDCKQDFHIADPLGIPQDEFSLFGGMYIAREPLNYSIPRSPRVLGKPKAAGACPTQKRQILDRPR